LGEKRKRRRWGEDSPYAGQPISALSTMAELRDREWREGGGRRGEKRRKGGR